MATDFLDKLAELDVPPPPARFDEQLHQKVNRSLAIGQGLDLVFGALPWALVEFARAFVGFLVYTATGRYESKPRGRRRR